MIKKALLFLFITFSFFACEPYDPYAGHSGDAVADEFVSLVNQHRQSIGLSQLEWHNGLYNVAYFHSQDMHNRDFFSHTNPDGETPFDRIADANITYQSAGENIAYGYDSAQKVLNAWLDSPGHKANIENPDYTHHGVGYVADGHYWTHLFAQNPQP